MRSMHKFDFVSQKLTLRVKVNVYCQIYLLSQGSNSVPNDDFKYFENVYSISQVMQISKPQNQAADRAGQNLALQKQKQK